MTNNGGDSLAKEVVKTSLSDDVGSNFKLQVVTVSDGYGSPIVFASLFVYILMRILVKGWVDASLAKKGVPVTERKAWVLRATLLPGLIAACVVDFTPIAATVGVPLHWIAAIPVGSVFYAAGGVAIHEFLKKYDPIGAIAGRFGLKVKDEAQQKEEAEEYFREHTDMINLKKLHEDVAAANEAAKDQTE